MFMALVVRTPGIYQGTPRPFRTPRSGKDQFIHDGTSNIVRGLLKLPVWAC